MVHNQTSRDLIAGQSLILDKSRNQWADWIIFGLKKRSYRLKTCNSASHYRGLNNKRVNQETMRKNMSDKPLLAALDLEGVLIPEIWIAVAERTGIEKLRLTTRDISDYDELMRGRIEVLKKNNLTLSLIQEVITTLQPLPGAADFLTKLRQRCQVIILSDTFYEFAAPLMAQLNWPTLFCNQLEVDPEDQTILDYHLRQPDGKKHAVKALRGLNFRVVATGDSYNDTSMLDEADSGILFRPAPAVKEQFPHFPATEDYEELNKLIR